MTAVPRHSCGACGEFLPHACAPVVEIRRLQFGRRQITITDREPEAEDWEAEAS